MYRRRRSAREPIAFSFDSFLDVVANVIGIIVRLILVAWVGARSYSATMQQADEPPPAVREMPAPTARDDSLHDELERVRRALQDARLRLLDQLGNLQLAEQQSLQARQQLAELQQQRQALEEQASRVSAALAGNGQRQTQAAVSFAELKNHAQLILKQIKALEAQPPQTHVLRYHTPVSQAVHADEMFFECRRGRVTFIDLPAFLQEIRGSLEDRAAVLKKQWQVSATTAPSGAFRLRYTVERDKSVLEGLGGTPVAGNFHYGLSEWVVEAIAEQRGETLEAALKESSEFRRLVDRVHPQITVVTFWVYPDSFELFRRLRDHLYERDIEVAGRPLTDDAPIAASRHGTASRGQ